MRALGFRLALTRVFEMADMGDCLAERGLEVGEVNWLGQEVERAPVHGRADIGHVAIGGDDHGGKLRRLFLELGEQRQSVHARHVDVGDDHVEIALVGEQSQGLHAIAREPECDRALFDLTAEPLPDQVFKVGLRSTASHRSSAEPTGEMTGVTLSGSTVASNQVFESSGGRALIPNAKGRRETQVSLDGSADPLVKDRQSDTKIDIVTTPVPTVVEPPRHSRQRNIMARYVFGEELRPGERWKRRLITR